MATNPCLYALGFTPVRVQLALDGVCEGRQREERPAVPGISSTGRSQVASVEVLPGRTHHNAAQTHTHGAHWNIRLPQCADCHDVS